MTTLAELFDYLESHVERRLAAAQTVALLIALSTVLYFIGDGIYLIYFHPLSIVPGPPLAKLGNWWQAYYATRLLKAEKIQEAHLQYGDVVRIGPNEISVSNPSLLKSVYGHGVPVLKTDFYAGGTFTGVDNIFTMRIREQHAARRKLMSRNFAQGPLMELVPQFIHKTEALCHKLESLGSGTLNVYPWLHRLGLEFILMQTLGYDPKLTENDTHHPALRDLEVFPENFAITAVFPFLKTHGVNIPIASINKPFRIQAGWVEYCMTLVKEERLKDSTSKSPWIRRMTEDKDEFLGRCLTDLEVSEEIISTLFAGSGTTSATLAFLVYAVTADRNIYNRLKSELRQAFPDWPRTSGLPAISEVQKLPFLNAVISESLRRFPTIPGSMPRQITSERLKVGDFEFPRNTVVSAQNYSLHMHQEYFPAPDKFCPERFLGEQAEKAKQGLNPFSEGPRGCLGRNLALLELQIVTALFFRFFEVQLDPAMKAKDMVMKVVFSGSPVGERLLLNLKRDTS